MRKLVYLTDVLAVNSVIYMSIASMSGEKKPDVSTTETIEAPAPPVEEREEVRVRGRWAGDTLVLEYRTADASEYETLTDPGVLNLSPSRGLTLAIAELDDLLRAAKARGAPVSFNVGGNRHD